MMANRLLALLILVIITGCAPRLNYAPVRSYHKDLVNSRYYQVKKGDTLYSIGYRSGHGYQTLARWNGLLPPYTLHIAQTIKLFNPAAKAHRSKSRPKTGVTSKAPVKSYVKKTLTQAKAHSNTKKRRTSSQKSSTISNDNKKVLKLFWQWPIKNKILKTFSQSGNKGIDIRGMIGQKVRSASSGKVVYSGSGLKGYGKLLIIKHNHIFLSAYANNSRLLVKEGQHIKKGQVIAEVGRVGGKQTSLHFEIRKNGKPVNPLHYLPKN